MGVCRGLLVFAVIGFSVCGWAREGEPVALFQPADGNGARSAGLVINHSAVSQLRSDVDAVSLGAVPLVTGDVANFRLTPLPIFSRNATIQLIRDDGTNSSVEQLDVKTWYGEDPDHPDRALFLAASEDGQVRAMVT